MSSCRTLEDDGLGKLAYLVIALLLRHRRYVDMEAASCVAAAFIMLVEDRPKFVDQGDPQWIGLDNWRHSFDWICTMSNLGDLR